MNKLLCFILLCAFSVKIAQGQECNEYYQLKDGSAWEFETYSGKGKLTGRNQQKVTSFNKKSNGFDATVNSTMFDEKGKELMKGDLEFKCENGTVFIDMRNFVSEEQLKAFSNYEMKIESENLEIPSSLSAGQSLKDGKIVITGVGSAIPMKMTVTITDRKVEAKESMTTPAGTFECFKITSKTKLQNQMGVTMNMEFSSVEWIAPKVGMVKSESYNRNGKLNGYTVLSKREN